jgi:flagellar basal body-associated protein FliL
MERRMGMKVNRKALIPILLVLVVLLSGIALAPLFVYAKETQFTWQKYAFAYITTVSFFLPLVIR